VVSKFSSKTTSPASNSGFDLENNTFLSAFLLNWDFWPLWPCFGYLKHEHSLILQFSIGRNEERKREVERV
jgi:hypothetical protein